jgi:hypothetical protein
MRTREKARIWRRFMAGESVFGIYIGFRKNNKIVPILELEHAIRDGATGKLDPIPMKQARAYAKAAGVKVGRMVKV